MCVAKGTKEVEIASKVNKNFICSRIYFYLFLFVREFLYLQRITEALVFSISAHRWLGGGSAD